MSIVTLTTDWGIRDYYVGALKGDILNTSENATVIDITHLVHQFDILSGAFVFRNAYRKFPNGTIHIIGISSKAKNNSDLIAIKNKGQYFIGMNDGFFSLVFDETPEEIISLETSGEKYSAFDQTAVVNAVSSLIKENNFNKLGKPLLNFVQKTHLLPAIEENIIRGTVIYVDDFENVVSNVTQEIFERIGKGKKFEIAARKNEYLISKLSLKYNDVEPGRILALFNSEGYLMLAINKGTAASLLGLNYGEIIRIEFK